jgi:anti-sigma regulatory factor (Ser/Thr protein kinase)
MAHDVTEEMAEVRLELQSNPESVTVTRAAVAGFAVAENLDDGLANALKTAVSEASNNVVIHAYGDDVGPLSLALATGHSGIEVLVQDRGGGFRRVIPSTERMGLGLPVISALADRAEFANRTGGGTEVRLSFDHGADVPAEKSGWLIAQSPPRPAELTGEIVGSISPPRLLEPVLGRVSRALAARSHFQVSRIDALRGVVAAVAEQPPTASTDGHVYFSLSGSTRRLELSVGPFVRVDDALAPLVDELRVKQTDAGAYAHLTVLDPR